MEGGLLGKLARRSNHVDDGILPFTVVGCGVEVVAAASTSGELLRVKEYVSVSSSGMVANFFRTCLRAGRRIGLLKRCQ